MSKNRVVKAALLFFGLLMAIFMLTYQPFLSAPAKYQPVKPAVPEIAKKQIFEGTSIKGLSWVEYAQNQQIYAVKIGSYQVKRKKLGFFKLGFMKEAWFNDVQININSDRLKSTNSSAPLGLTFSSNISDQIPAHKNFSKGLLNDDQIEQFGLAEAKTLMISQLQINVLDSQGQRVSFSAGKATINPWQRRLILQKDVKVTSRDNGILQCDELYLPWEGGKLVVEGVYTLTVNNHLYQGKRLTTNYLLEDVDFNRLKTAK